VRDAVTRDFLAYVYKQRKAAAAKKETISEAAKPALDV